MQTEIVLSASKEPSTTPWIWRVWEQGRLIARGRCSTEEEAHEAARALVGHDPRVSARRSPTDR